MGTPSIRVAELTRRMTAVQGHITIRVQSGEDPKALCEELYRTFLSLEVTVYDPSGDHILAMR